MRTKKENEGDLMYCLFEKDENGEYKEKYIEVEINKKENEGTPIDITSK